MTEPTWKHWTPERDGHAPDDWEGSSCQYDESGKWVFTSIPIWQKGMQYRYRPIYSPHSADSPDDCPDCKGKGYVGGDDTPSSCGNTAHRYRPLQDATYEPDLLAQCLALPQDQREALIEAMQKQVELKPCPFCGSATILMMEAQNIGGRSVGNPYRVTCNQCFCSTSQYRTEAEAIASWNRRAS